MWLTVAKISGCIMVLGGSIILGLKMSVKMSKRICELRELERILGMLEGELRFRKNPMAQCFNNISGRCMDAFGRWLSYMSKLLSGGCDSFMEVWREGMEMLKVMRYDARISLTVEDIEELEYIGQALLENHTDSQLNALLLEKTALKNKITGLANELQDRKKVTISLCSLGGIMLVILLGL